MAKGVFSIFAVQQQNLPLKNVIVCGRLTRILKEGTLLRQVKSTYLRRTNLASEGYCSCIPD